jgi:hypothetical protein
MIIDPPEAPTAGIKSKASNTEGQNLFINNWSKAFILVSCRQITSQELSKILSLTASHFLSEFMPLTFQHKIFHVLVAIKEI